MVHAIITSGWVSGVFPSPGGPKWREPDFLYFCDETRGQEKICFQNKAEQHSKIWVVLGWRISVHFGVKSRVVGRFVAARSALHYVISALVWSQYQTWIPLWGGFGESPNRVQSEERGKEKVNKSWKGNETQKQQIWRLLWVFWACQFKFESDFRI